VSKLVEFYDVFAFTSSDRPNRKTTHLSRLVSRLNYLQGKS
jgi:hypothetical protein